MDRIAQVAAGTGSMEEQAHKQYMRDMRRAASGGNQPVQKATVASLAAIGIAVETVPAAGEPAPKATPRRSRKPATT